MTTKTIEPEPTLVTDLSTLRPGDVIEIRQGDITTRGPVGKIQTVSDGETTRVDRVTTPDGQTLWSDTARPALTTPKEHATVADHYVVVTRDEHGLARLAAIRPLTDQDRADYYRLDIECSTPGGCGGWQECDGDHTGYDPDDATSPAYDQWDGVMIHGVEHEWQYGPGWTIPYIGCPAQERTDDVDMAGISTATDGRYALDVEWGDTDCYLTALEGDTP